MVMQRRTENSEKWVVTLGTRHGVRDRAALHAATVESDRTAATTRLSLDRWTHIVAAMTDLVSAYNAGFDREVLSIADDRSDPDFPVVTVHAGDEGSPSLTAALEGTLICVRSRDGEGLTCIIERPLLAERDDDQTATYILQHWMERL
jgi:hypothetical protein